MAVHPQLSSAQTAPAPAIEPAAAAAPRLSMAETLRAVVVVLPLLAWVAGAPNVTVDFKEMVHRIDQPLAEEEAVHHRA